MIVSISVSTDSVSHLRYKLLNGLNLLASTAYMNVPRCHDEHKYLPW